MLSKEEIESMKIGLWNIRADTLKAMQCSLADTSDKKEWQKEINVIDNALKYIDKLESDKQKLIEKLEERIKAVDKCYNELLTDVGGIKIINVTGLTKKEKEEVINKRNCLLVQKHCYVEILSILKGKKKEAE